MNNEMDWIREITPQHKHQTDLQVGIGDDAAVYHLSADYETVVCVDTMVEEVHFKKQTMPLQAVGYKALSANISDLAAMGAIPLYYLVSIIIPKTGWSKSDLKEIYEGMKKLGDEHKMDLIGGDTVSTKEMLAITVTVIGKLEKGRRLLRSQAQPGDTLFTTGNLGSSAYGLEKLLAQGLKCAGQKEIAPYIQAHQYPEPQVKAGRILAESGFRIALNDISDGLASEAKEIAVASNAAVHIEWDKIPKAKLIGQSAQERQENWVLYGGEDYQLVGTVSPKHWESLVKEFEKESLSIYKIGFISEGKGEVFLLKNGNTFPIRKTGYDHL